MNAEATIIELYRHGYPQQEILDFALYPSELAEQYRDMLNGLKDRGLEEVAVRHRRPQRAEISRSGSFPEGQISDLLDTHHQ